MESKSSTFIVQRAPKIEQIKNPYQDSEGHRKKESLMRSIIPKVHNEITSIMKKTEERYDSVPHQIDHA